MNSLIRSNRTLALSAIVAALCVSPVLSPASAKDLRGTDIKQAVSGKTLHVSTPVGSLPISFGSNGTMRARSSTIAKLTGVAKDRGRWWVKNGKLCQKWKIWLEGKAHCVSVRKNGARLVWTSSSGKTGVARVSSN